MTPPSMVTRQTAIAAIVRYLDASRATTCLSTYDHFRRALSIWEAALRRLPMKPWLEACRDVEFGLDPLARALTILLEQAADNYDDVPGGVYMALSQGHRSFGQYFTPFPVARMMAELALSEVTLPAQGEPPLTFLEPAVGSGVMILAAADVLERRFPGAIAEGRIEFYGQDIDECCVAMCRLNMLLHGIGRRVEQANARPFDGSTIDTAQPGETGTASLLAENVLEQMLIPRAPSSAEELWTPVEATVSHPETRPLPARKAPRPKHALQEAGVDQTSLW
jgi:hypothetical protein